MAMSAAQQQQAQLQRLKTLVFVERITRKVIARWGSPEGMLQAAQAGDTDAAGLVEMLKRATQRRGIEWLEK